MPRSQTIPGLTPRGFVMHSGQRTSPRLKWDGAMGLIGLRSCGCGKRFKCDPARHSIA